MSILRSKTFVMLTKERVQQTKVLKLTANCNSETNRGREGLDLDSHCPVKGPQCGPDATTKAVLPTPKGAQTLVPNMNPGSLAQLTVVRTTRCF